MDDPYGLAAPPLAPRALAPLPLGAITPEGWLLAQLRVQADGLTGYLDEFWPDLSPANLWLGGSREGWERGPYYADGLVPLAYLLQNERLLAKAHKWVEAFLGFQDDSGWIGPTQAPGYQPYDVWPVTVVLKVLTQHHEATGDPRVLEVMRRFCGYLCDHLSERPLHVWGASRWGDLVLSIFWLYQRTRAAWLLDVAALARRQGYDWTRHFTDFAYRRKLLATECRQETHVVNNAMAIKTPGVWYRQSHSEQDRQAVYAALDNLDRFHGQVTGVFSGDEHYAGLEPFQGTELCAVVEYLFSLECLMSILGDPALGDRLEKTAYNALPATFSPDMWAHQYDQQVNQVLCTVAPRAWTNNGPHSNIFGLEPNYGCCTANMHQGWPKLASHLWMACPGQGLAAVAYAPCRVTATVRGGQPVTLVEETGYPFDDRVLIEVQGSEPLFFPLSLRIPAWAVGATLRAGDREEAALPGSFHSIERVWQPGEVVELRLPMAVRATRRLHGAVALERGPLVYSLRIGEEWRAIGGKPPHQDWEVYPTTPWNYGLLLDPEAPERSVSVHTSGVRGAPFSPKAAPVELCVQGRRVPGWGLEDDSAGPVPERPSGAGQVEALTLIPYGCTNLRVTEFPLLEGEP